MNTSKFVVESYTDRSLADIEKATEAGLERAALYVENKIPLTMPKNPRVEGGQGGWIKHFGNLARSKPGRPPMQQTGRLARNIISGKISRLRYAVGTRKGFGSAPYGFYLDQGTADMKARPWLGIFFKKNQKQINKAFETGMRRALGDDR